MFKTVFRKVFTGGTISSSGNEITILYGGKSGNSAFVAKEAGRYFHQNGIKVAVQNMSRYDISRLEEEKMVFIVVSTHGEGDPPPAAAGFYSKLFSSAYDLTRLSYSVCALGDSSYEFFCQTGRNIDARLKELGAKCIFGRIDCDADFEVTAATWIKGVLEYRLAAGNNVPVQLEASCQTDWFDAVVTEKYQLNKGEMGEVFHVVIKCSSGDVSFLPGDSIGLLPENPKELVNEILGFLKYSCETSVAVNGQERSIGDLLLHDYEITTLSRDVIARYQKLACNDLLSEQMKDEEGMKSCFVRHDLLDFLKDFPAQLSPEQFISVLRRVRPRYYSIASSQRVYPGEIHLTVKQVSFVHRDRVRLGACSSYVGSHLRIGDKLKFYLVRSAGFHLPGKSDIPLIMIGAGTGVAPFRAFLLERAITGNGRNWLIFGEKQEENDFLYRSELETWKKLSVLTNLHTAFSRDGAQKYYVQDRILEHGKEFLEWMEQGASVYVCGSMAMGRGVKNAVISLYEKKLNIHQEDSRKILQKLVDEGRYCEDLY